MKKTYNAKEDKKKLENLKKLVEKAYKYQEDNIKRFYENTKYVCKTSLSDGAVDALKKLGRSIIEFNIQEAYVSRLRGEFYKQEPEIEVMSEYLENANPQLIAMVEGIIRRILDDAKNDGTQYNIITESLVGGYSIAKVVTEYIHPMSFEQTIKFKKVYDPCLCGADPMARDPHKGDADFWYEFYPKTKEEVKTKWGIDVEKLNFDYKTADGFTWSYKTGEDDILMVCELFKKKKSRFKIVELADFIDQPSGKIIRKKVMSKKSYEEEFLPRWERLRPLEEAPSAIKERYTEQDIICRTVFIGEKILDYKELDYKYHPLVFFDGNSANIRETIGSCVKQMTRGYTYHLRGAQNLKNVAGQTIANHLELLSNAKMVVPIEGLPEQQEYIDHYLKPQFASVYFYRSFMKMEDGSAIPITPPQPIQNPQLPPEAVQAFTLADNLTQVILGSYDASLGINDNQLSGVAMLTGAAQSNAAAMPHIIGYIHGINQVAQIILDLIPKYIVSPRKIAILNKKNEREEIVVNQEGGIKLDYDPDQLNIRVKAGASFSAQKARALQQLQGLMQMSPLAAEILGGKGIGIILNQIEMPGIEQLKETVAEAIAQKEQEAQMEMQRQQQEMQNNPLIMRAQNEQMKIMKDAEKDKMDAQLKGTQIAVDAEKIKNERIKLAVEEGKHKQEMAAKAVESQTQQMHDEIKLMQSYIDLMHRHSMDNSADERAQIELLQKIIQMANQKVQKEPKIKDIAE